jgi:DNA-binding HxlR family transcriptional regulator
MLTMQLREPEEHGVIERKVYAESHREKVGSAGRTTARARQR